ncbi:MAG: DUF11 domain-containing protein [Planctomycetaceae bacterium]|jgi:hypothetical protein|nr:DUF11 domain-containing protein [Planctomycetaceae bacterium]
MALDFLQKESVMLNRTLLLAAIVAVGSSLLLIGTNSPVFADEKAFTSDALTVILGQTEARRSPSFFDPVKQFWNRITQDDDSNNSQNKRSQSVAPPAIPVQPPKPVTAVETQQFADPSGQAPQRPSAAFANSTSSPRARTIAMSPRENWDEGDGDDAPLQHRLASMRKAVFEQSYESIEAAAKTTRQSSGIPSQTSLVPLPPAFDQDNDPRGFTRLTPDASGYPSDSRLAANMEGIREIASPNNFSIMPRNIQNPPGQRNGQAGEMYTAQQNDSRIAAMTTEQRSPSGQRLTVMRSPRFEFEIEEPPSVAVNQEVTHKIRVTNTGDAPGEVVVVETEIPSWTDIQHWDASNGDVVLRPREDGSGIADLKWKILRIDPGATDLLVLRSIPRIHRSIEFPIRYDFYRPAIISKVEVQEPKLEMELLGDNEVRWDGTAVYTLLVRNVGNGSAEKVRLDLLQTSSEASFCEIPEPLRPGETQEMNIEVQPRGDQEYIDIAVVATGSHDVKGEIKRRVKVLRPKLEMSVQTLPLHFVDSPAELTVRIRNVGTADADNVLIRAELPLGAQYRESNGGLYTVQQQQNVVEWRGKSIARNESQTFTLVCAPQREGECRVSVEISETNGNVLATANGMFRAEAVVELDWAVVKPNGPIELGQEVEYEIQVTNTGTKAAENVEISMTFGSQLEPTGVSGGEAYSTDDGQVFFEKIPAVLPKQCVAVKVAVKAEKVGTATIRAEVVRDDAGGASIRLERGLSAYIVSRRGVATASGQTQTQDEVFK